MARKLQVHGLPPREGIQHLEPSKGNLVKEHSVRCLNYENRERCIFTREQRNKKTCRDIRT